MLPRAQQTFHDPEQKGRRWRCGRRYVLGAQRSVERLDCDGSADNGETNETVREEVQSDIGEASTPPQESFSENLETQDGKRHETQPDLEHLRSDCRPRGSRSGEKLFKRPG
jgi:hypothetical protein